MPVTTEEIREGVAELLEECAGVNPSDVADDKRFEDDLDVDDLSMLEVMVAIEERFHIKISDDEWVSIKIVGEAVALIESKGNQS